MDYRFSKGTGFQTVQILKAVGENFGVVSRKDGSNEMIVGDFTGDGAKVYKADRLPEGFYADLKEHVVETLVNPIVVFTPPQKDKKATSKPKSKYGKRNDAILSALRGA